MMDVVEKVSDRIVLINQGEIVANGTISELRMETGDSLEQIFAKLISTGQPSRKAGEFAAAFSEQNNP
jgi:ABC-2 type transport system ATP-binding protein